MIRLATVFSGIGAIEHALDRMQLEHKIVFACDNGDIEILTKDVGMNLDAISEELSDLENMVDSIHENNQVQDLYKDQLIAMLKEAITEYDGIVSAIQKQDPAPDGLNDILNRITASSEVKKARLKEYNQFKNELNNGSSEQQLFRRMQIILEVANDFIRQFIERSW